MKVGDIVWFDPSVANPHEAFCYEDKPDKPFKVKILSRQEDGVLDVTPTADSGVPPRWTMVCQLVNKEQLFPTQAYADILKLIEQLKWLSVEQEEISMKELMDIYEAIKNGK